MKRLIALMGAVVLATALSAPASGAQNSPLTLVLVPGGYDGGETQNPVEQQSDWPWLPGPIDCSADAHCIVNSSGCRWDVDDHWELLEVNRYLDPGVTASLTPAPCVVSDANPQHRTINGLTRDWSTHHGSFGVSFTAASPDLVAVVTYQPQNRSFTLVPFVNGHGYEYDWCGQVVYGPSDPALAPIAGSASGTDGLPGYGVITTISLTVSNPTARRVRDIQFSTGLVGVGATANSCPANSDTLVNHSYPFAWSP